MNTTIWLKRLFLAGFVLLSGFVLACLGVSISWGVTIHETAYHCTDDTGAFLGFLDSHELCKKHDTLNSGWTWDKIEAIRGYHISAFWFIFLAPLILMILSHSLAPRKMRK